MFLGYSNEHKGSLCYDPVARHTRISRNVIFVENVPYYSLTQDSQALDI